MDWHIGLYMAVLLAYIGYPLYLLMSPVQESRVRVLAIGLVVYGLAGLFWPGGVSDYLQLAAGFSLVAGMVILFRAPMSGWPWMLAMAYSLAVLGSASVQQPVWTLVAALVFGVGFERTLVRPLRQVTHG